MVVYVSVILDFFFFSFSLRMNDQMPTILNKIKTYVKQILFSAFLTFQKTTTWFA